MMDILNPRILRVDAGGLPIDWVSLKEAVICYSLGVVLWEVGAQTFLMRGGHNRHGDRSEVNVAPIIATASRHRGVWGRTPALTNEGLFARDRHICLYCGERFAARQLSRDHVIPQSCGGPDTWDNTVSACKGCNGSKGARTPEEAGMPLLALPYAPNEAEALILKNRFILADQNDYLSRMVPDRGKRWQ